jgi:uncharacterized repeat protein (TIGR01451 family)
MKKIKDILLGGLPSRETLFESSPGLAVRPGKTGKTLAVLGAGLALLGITVLPGQAAGLKSLPGRMPAVVSGLTAIGLLPATTNLDLAIGLPLRNREALTNLLQQIYDPASPNFHHYLTPQEFTAQFGPSEQDYQAVINFARTNGLEVTRTYSNRMLLDVRAPATNVERSFHVHLRVYKHPTENRDFYAPDVNPSVPSGLPIQDISGLNNYRRPHPNIKIKTVRAVAAATSVPNATPNVGSGPSGSYIGDDFRNAYAPGTTLNGSGQTIALVQFDGYYASDIQEYENLAGRTNIPLQNVLIDGFNGLPTGNGGEVEVSLDIEMVVSMAPALARVIVYEGNPYNFIPNDVLNRIANGNAARQISCSWGWTGGPSATTDQIFQQMALQGQTFFTASGDSDAYPSGSVDNPSNFGTPADSPYVTSVGGTTLTMNGQGASYSSETVWNVGPSRDGEGSSGGFSSYYSIPSWQTNINMTARGGSATTRNFPDVALTADGVYEITDGGNVIPDQGGTSAAAPLWAGFTALINQQAAANGRTNSVGFLNPALYAIANSINYNACFHDVKTGNNTWSGSPNLFYAVTNYDLCTGLGTPNGTNLINALTAAGVSNVITHLSPPPAPYGSTLSALNGGNPNGTWELFIQDDSSPYSGAISNGWILTVTTANPVGASADVALSMSASATNVTLSNNVTFTVGVANYGPTTVSSNVIVSDNLPLSATLISTNVTRGSVVRSGSTLIWNVGNLTNAAGAQLTLALQPNTVGNMLNYALASVGTPDPNPDDNAASVTVVVSPASPPQLAASYVSASHTFQFTVSGSSAPTIIEASTNLVDWVPIYTNSTAPFTFTDPNAANYPYRFYRAVQ